MLGGNPLGGTPPLPIKIDEPLCLLLTANISAKASAGNTIQISPLTEKDVQMGKEVSLLGGAIPYQIGGVQTIERIYLNNPTDSLLLVRWCRAMKGEDWERKWDFSQSVGKWHGIDLMQNGKVRGISLVGNNLQGDLSDEIFTDDDGAITSEMQYFNCSGNKITGQIPEKIGKCKKLEYLDVSKNQMGGKVTNSLGEVVNLVTLWLSLNSFEELPESIRNCQRLRNLHCNQNKITHLPEGISKLANLEVARFEGNQLKKLPTNFASLPNLKECYLQNNALHFEHLEPLAERADKLKTFVYAPQAKIGEEKEFYVEEGKMFELQVDSKGKNNQYTWHKDGKSYQTTQTPTYKELINTEKTGTYTLMIQNSKCKDLTLESYAYKVKMYCNANLYQVGGNPLGGNPLQVFAENSTIFCANERIEAILNVRTPNNDLSEETTGRQSAFQWLKESVPIHQANNQNFTATEIGNYALRISLKSGCVYLSEEINVSQVQAIAISLQKEGNLLRAITTQEVTNYEWFLNNRLLTQNITMSIDIVESGSYKVRVTDKNGCKTSSKEEIMRVTAVDDVRIESLAISIYPNPSKDIFCLRTLKNTINNILIHDAIGRIVHRKFFVMPVKEYTFSLENKAIGIYWIEIQTNDDYKTTRKIMKE